MTFEDVLGNSLAFVPFLTGTHANILTRRRVPDDFDLIRFVCFFRQKGSRNVLYLDFQ